MILFLSYKHLRSVCQPSKRWKTLRKITKKFDQRNYFLLLSTIFKQSA